MKNIGILTKFGFGLVNCNYACGQSRFLFAGALKLFCQYSCPNSTLANIEIFPSSSTTTTTTAATTAVQALINQFITNRPPIASNPSPAVSNPAANAPPPAAAAPAAPPAAPPAEPPPAAPPAK